MSKIYQKNIFLLKNPAKRNINGFTLIELLVVVLIIGILAAIALPKYETAVLRSKMTEIVIMTETLHKARLRVQMAQGEMPITGDALDISWPSSCRLSAAQNVLSCPKTAYLLGFPEYTAGENETNSYIVLTNGKRRCRAVADNKAANQACLSLGYVLTQANHGDCSLATRCNTYNEP